MTNENGIYFASGAVVAVIATYGVFHLVALPRIKEGIVTNVTNRVISLIRNRAGIDPSVLSPYINQEVSVPIAEAVVEAMP